MCRSIKKLRDRDERAGDTEIWEAALQFVRKISGYRVPSSANQEAFDNAVEEIADASRHLLDKLVHRDAGVPPHRVGPSGSPEVPGARSGRR